MKLLVVAVAALTAACASATPGKQVSSAPAAVPAASAESANAGLSIYEGTYALQGEMRQIDLRVWVDAEGKLNAEMVGTGRQTVLRPTSTPNRFLHATSDNVWFQFTVENGRATAASMGQGDRVASGPRKG